MSREKRLAKNTVIYFIGSFGSKILSFLLLPIYSSYLTQSAFGSYDLINTMIQIAYPVITLVLDNAMYVYLIGTQDVNRKEDIIAVAVRILLRNSIISVAICLFVNFLHPIEYICWIILWFVSFSAYNMWIQICRGFNMQKLYSITGIIVTMVILVGNIVGLVVLKQGYKFLIISNSLAYITAIIFIEIQVHIIRYSLKGRRSKSLKKELLTYTIPLLPNQLSWWIINVSDRLMLSYFWGTSANGVYAMACKIPAIMNVINSIFNMAWSDDILSSADIKETELYAEKIYNRYVQVMIGVSLILISSNQFIFKYIIAGNFVEAYKYTYFLYLSCIFSALASCLGAFYGYYKKSANVSISTIAAAAVNLFINVVFMEEYGIQVASISTFLGFLVMWLIRLAGLKGMVTIRISNSNKCLFIILIPFYFTYRVEGLLYNILLILLGCILAVIINKKTILEFSIKVKKAWLKRNYMEG